MTSLISQLRGACHELHEGLHAHPLLKPLVEPEVTLGDVKSALSAFYLAYRDIDAQAPNDSLPDSPVLDWLAKDIRFHQIDVPEIPGERLVIDTPSRMAGYLYVKQGSTLGGQMISKHLKKHLALEPEVGNHFFYGYGEQTGEQWKRFTGRLEDMAPTLQSEEVISGAVDTFGAIARSCDSVWKQSHA